jgi:hypothetical protein
MIAPKVSYDMSVVKAPQATITKKPVSFFDTTEPAQPPKQAPAPAPALKLPNRRPVKAQQELQEEDHVSELENLHIGITGIIDRHIPQRSSGEHCLPSQQTQPLATTTKPTKPKRVMTEKQLAHLANMRKKKAEKRATLAKQQPTQPQQPQQPIQQAIPQQPTQPRQQTQPRQPTQQQQQPISNIEDVIKTQFERLYNEKETIRQNQKAIRRSEKQKVLDKIIAQQRLNAIAHQQVQPVVQPVVQPPPPKVESTAGKKHRYRMNPHGGIETYYE